MFITKTLKMKIISLPFLLLILVSHTKASTSVLRIHKNIVIDKLFGMLRNIIKNGSAEADVPVLDPYVFDSIQFYYPGNYLSLKANITNGIFSGLGNFHVQSYEFETNNIAMELDVRIPVLIFEAEYYEIWGNIWEAIPILGQGSLHFKVYNLKFLYKVYLKQSEDGKAIMIDKFENPNYEIDRIVSQTQYDNKIDDIFNAMVEDLLAGYLNRFSKFISMSYIDAVQQTLNHCLSKFETWDILAILLQ